MLGVFIGRRSGFAAWVETQDSPPGSRIKIRRLGPESKFAAWVSIWNVSFHGVPDELHRSTGLAMRDLDASRR